MTMIGRKLTIINDKSVIKYIPEDGNQFVHLADLPQPCNEASIIAIDTFIYMLGGAHSRRDIHVYNSSNNGWICLENMLKEGRAEAAAVSIDSRIIIGGGGDYASGSVFSSVEVFSVEGEHCGSIESHGIPNLRRKRWKHAAVAIKDNMYSMGGETGNGKALKSCECVNITTFETASVPSMNKKRKYPSAATNGDTIYVSGGMGASSIEMYTPATNKWTNLTDMTFTRHHHSSIVYSGQLYLVGGWHTYHIESIDLMTMEHHINRAMESTINSTTQVLLVAFQIAPEDLAEGK